MDVDEDRGKIEEEEDPEEEESGDASVLNLDEFSDAGLLLVPTEIERNLARITAAMQQAMGKSLRASLDRLMENMSLHLVLPDFRFPIVEQAQAALSRALEGYTEHARAFFSRVAESLSYLDDLLQHLHEQYQVTEAEAVQVMQRYNWFPSPSVDAVLVFDVVKIEREGGHRRGAINCLFVNHYCSDNYAGLVDLVKGWKENRLFQPRLRILRDCVQTLRIAGNRYNASNVILPTLLAQIDGIASAYYVQQTGSPPPRNSHRLKQELKELTAGGNYIDAIHDAWLDLLLQTAYYGDPLDRPTTFSRHKIMHGEQLRYGRIDNVVRAFLILDFLSALR